MSILVTGGAGFIGSHITDELINNNYEVIIVDNLYTGKKENINTDARFYELDIRSPDIEKIFQENKIEYVIHHAAQASVGSSMKDPVYDMSVNIQGSLNLLSLSARHGVKRFIAASTAAVYGHPEYLPVDEKHPTNFLSFYGLSKHTMEQYIKLFGLDYIIFRYANVYGPRQDAFGEAGVISIYIDRMKEQLPIEIHGDGSQTRDFIYVSDIANANLKAVQTTAKNITLNLSTNAQTSIIELFNTLKDLTGYKIQPIYTDTRAGDIKDSCLDNSFAKEILGWHPKVELKQGLEKTIGI